MEDICFETPILFVIFNRPDTTQKVFDEIKKIKPKYLFIAADGARNENERNICQEARNIINQVDWDCELKTLFQEKNLGCRIGVITAIDWFFDNVDQGIILEDDCLPSLSFFYFCELMLDTYRDNTQIMHISGVNFLRENQDSYYFSKFTFVWGWATWKRSWAKYDINMSDFYKFKKKKVIHKIFKNKIIVHHWLLIFLKSFKNKIMTAWDYQWTFTVWNNDGLSIVPGSNLVSNIGFDERATHTKFSESKLSRIPVREIKEIKLLDNISTDELRDVKMFEVMSGLNLNKLNLNALLFTFKERVAYIAYNLNIKK